MGVVQARIDVPHQHRATAARDVVRLRRGDLPHIPLESRQLVAVARRLVAVPVVVATLVLDRWLEPERQRIRIGGAFDVDAFLRASGELSIAGTDNDDADLSVARDDRASLQLKLAEESSRNILLLREHNVGLWRRRRGGCDRGLSRW